MMRVNPSNEPTTGRSFYTKPPPSAAHNLTGLYLGAVSILFICRLLIFVYNFFCKRHLHRHTYTHTWNLIVKVRFLTHLGNKMSG